MRTQRISMLAVVALATTALAVPTSQARGGTQTVKSTITIRQERDALHGEVKAGEVACVQRREGKGGDQTTHTDGDAKSELHARFPADYVIALVSGSLRHGLRNVYERDKSTLRRRWE